MRKILFSVIALLALLLAAEVGVTLLSQHGMERALRAQYELPSNLEVNINSFPYLVSLTRNHLGELQLTWEGELDYALQEGTLESMPYACRVNLYDVELNMPSLLTGKLEIRDISRLKAAISMDTGSLNEALGGIDGGFFIEDDKIFALVAGKKTQYRVKVTGDYTISIEPYASSTTTEGSGSNPDAQVKTVDIVGLPMESTLYTASIDGDKVVLEISIPMWEGYL